VDQHDALAIEVRIADALLPRIAARMERNKRERGLLDYGDMLAWLASALDEDGGTALATTLRERYHYALIDEFQDTDELQWKIFRRIFIEGEKNFIYLIGDPKQAIYSFRGRTFSPTGRPRRIDDAERNRHSTFREFPQHGKTDRGREFNPATEGNAAVLYRRYPL